MNSEEVFEYVKNILVLPEAWVVSKGKDLFEYKCTSCSIIHSRTKSNICEIINYSKYKLLTCSINCANANKKITHEEFVTRCNVLFNSKYSYPNPLVNTSTLLKIICPIHGEFIIKPRVHLQGGKGCLKCYTDIRVKSQDTWLQDTYKVWGKKYEYPQEYCGAHTNIQIVCKVHGVFMQTPANHLSGKGCFKCAQELSGFNKTKWLSNSKTSRKFDSYKVYILLVYNESESFIKIGRTYTTTKYRYGNTKLNNYKFNIIAEFIFESGEDCWNKEIELHRKYSQFSYTPQNSFEGMTECFNLSILKDFKQ